MRLWLKSAAIVALKAVKTALIAAVAYMAGLHFIEHASEQVLLVILSVLTGACALFIVAFAVLVICQAIKDVHDEIASKEVE